MNQNFDQYPAMNPTFTVVEQTREGNNATVIIEPLEQGYGHTIGNALRRVMLSSLPGHAIVKVRINGVDHQFSTLEGMKEDIVEMILNLKEVRIKSDSSTPGTLRIDVKGAREVTAADIDADGGFEVVNKDQYICTLADGKSLNIEMVVEPGVGYSMATERKDVLIGEIPVDALFSPVVKASYAVDATRVGRRTDFDRIVLDVQTNGTIEPLEAVEQAAKILARQFNQLFNPMTEPQVTEESHLSPEEAEVLRLTVEELDLPTRIANALRKGGFKTVGDLAGAPRDVIAKVKNLGGKSVELIEEALQKKGVTLG
ncbi:DNA-directed RNA polymerase subunit alpha [Patescibacteria group bacterium]|nr:DNA-directed RNA polymerase subunit alpha [Patescibacteria group bacterium]